MRSLELLLGENLPHLDIVDGSPVCGSPKQKRGHDVMTDPAKVAMVGDGFSGVLEHKDAVAVAILRRRWKREADGPTFPTSEW
jgi:hypothetical protein